MNGSDLDIEHALKYDTRYFAIKHVYKRGQSLLSHSKHRFTVYCLLKDGAPVVESRRKCPNSEHEAKYVNNRTNPISFLKLCLQGQNWKYLPRQIVCRVYFLSHLTKLLKCSACKRKKINHENDKLIAPNFNIAFCIIVIKPVIYYGDKLCSLMSTNCIFPLICM